MRHDSFCLRCYGDGMREKLHHERAYAVPAERVFSQFADPQARAKWSTPANDALVYDEASFREGGRDLFPCGPPNNL